MRSKPRPPADASTPQPAQARSAKAASHAVSPARREAFGILLELERSEAHADTLLRGARIDALSVPDRHLATTLVMGVLRWQIRLDALIRPLLAKPNARLDAEIRIALRLGAFQLLYLDRIPAHAAIGESVALAKLAGHKFASGMVNAVLRKLAAQPRSTFDPASATTASQVAAATAHPAWLVERWAACYGLKAAGAICEHGQHAPALSLRLDAPELEAELTRQGIVLASGGVLTAARRIVSGDVVATAEFHSGRIRMQDEGSQLVAELAAFAIADRNSGSPARVLDACAAPGGKTLILAERMAESHPGATITACEINPVRLAAFRQRLAAIPSAANIQLMEADAAQLPAQPAFDLALVDAPCSGTGTLDRNPEIRHRLRPEELARHHERQCAILVGVLRACENARNPRVLYSTCSLEPEENEHVVREVLQRNGQWQLADLAPVIDRLDSSQRLAPGAAASLSGALSAKGTLTLLPYTLGADKPTDGFYAALLQKRP